MHIMPPLCPGSGSGCRLNDQEVIDHGVASNNICSKSFHYNNNNELNWVFQFTIFLLHLSIVWHSIPSHTKYKLTLEKVSKGASWKDFPTRYINHFECT